MMFRFKCKKSKKNLKAGCRLKRKDWISSSGLNNSCLIFAYKSHENSHIGWFVDGEYVK